MNDSLRLIDKINNRQTLYHLIREFFARRRVLEVETPVLEKAPNPSPYLEPLKCESGEYLQSSPEFYMKRLLAAGSGDIFQICKSFRAKEMGRWHRPEFSILEWYRIGFNLTQLQQELIELLGSVGYSGVKQTAEYTYGELFSRHLSVDPYLANADELRIAAESEGLDIAPDIDDRAGWLNLLFSAVIEPKLANEQLVIVRDFPEELSMLSRLEQRGSYRVAARFEVYAKGVELANAFWELRDSAEQAVRFKQDLQQRHLLKLDEQLPWPDEFLNIVGELPDCAGIAVGLDRLLAVIRGVDSLTDVLLF